jgi:hypothetical protein
MGRPTSRPSPVASLDNFYRGTLSGHGADGHGSRRNGGWSRALTRRAAELAWIEADEGGPRSSRQLLALGIDSAADEGSFLLPRRARLDGPTPVGQDPAEFLASAEQLLRRICVVGAPPRLLGLRALVAELILEANTGAGA